jgi:hypothetical protein
MKGKSICQKCKKEEKELYSEKQGSLLVCALCYDLNKDNPPRKDDSYFKEHINRRR